MSPWLTQSRTHVPTCDLSDADLDEMYALYGPNHHVSREQFYARVRDQLDYVAHFRLRRDGRLIGFTGVRARVMTLESGRKIPTVYSGLSFILPEHRGGGQVVFVLAYHALRMKLRMPRETVIIWSDNISYKPYLLTARHIRRFYPSRFAATPDDMEELRGALGRRYYGELYEPASGTVRKPARRLKAHLAPIGARELEDPDIRFYAEQNPGHAEGEGLLTLIPADLANIFTACTYGLRRPKRRKPKSLQGEPARARARAS